VARKKPKNKGDAEWAKAKRLCRLSAEDIRMAKELGMNPRKLIKNIPSKSEPWKAPVRIWIRGLYEKRLGKRRNGPARKGGSKARSNEPRQRDAAVRPARSGPHPDQGDLIPDDPLWCEEFDELLAETEERTASGEERPGSPSGSGGENDLPF